MTPKRIALSFFITLTAFSLLPLTAAAEKMTAEQLLATVDATLTKAKDQYFEYDLITFEPGKDPKILRFKVNIQGKKKRRIEFTAPGDVKGMRFLILDVDQMYVYLPAYKKVRRVASHVKSQGFMGSAYTQDDMSLTQFGETYTAKIIGQDDKVYKMEMTRKPGKTFPYPKLEVHVRKKIYQPVAITYFNEKGMKVKSEKREGLRCEDGICNPRLFTMIDHTRNDLKSQMVEKAWKLNTGISEREFTVRALQRRR